MIMGTECGYDVLEGAVVEHLVGVDDLGRADIERLLDLAGTLESRDVEHGPPVLT
jgi:hypothetical protein